MVFRCVLAFLRGSVSLSVYPTVSPSVRKSSDMKNVEKRFILCNHRKKIIVAIKGDKKLNKSDVILSSSGRMAK